MDRVMDEIGENTYRPRDNDQLFEATISIMCCFFPPQRRLVFVSCIADKYLILLDIFKAFCDDASKPTAALLITFPPLARVRKKC